MRLGPIGMVRERFRWGSYGVVGGLLVGIILGWFFHGVVSWIVRFGFVLLLLVPLVAVFLFWRRIEGRGASTKEGPIETAGAVVEVRPRRREE